MHHAPCPATAMYQASDKKKKKKKKKHKKVQVKNAIKSDKK